MSVSRVHLIFTCIFIFFAHCSATTNSSSPETKLKIVAIFGHLGKSHFDVFKPLMEELARRGHELTVISYFPRTQKAIAEEPLPTYKDISLLSEQLKSIFVNVVDLKVIDHSYFKILTELNMLKSMATQPCKVALSNPEVKRLIESGEKFDVVLTENFNTNCFLALVHKLNAPYIQMSSHQLMPWAVDQLGISHEASYIPVLFTRLPRTMNFIERVYNVIAVWLTTTVYDTVFAWHDQSIVKEAFGPDVPDLKEVGKNASLMMVNTHYTLHGAQLFPANVIELGGLHIPPKTNPLPKDIAKFLDEAHEGVLYFNLGSMVKMSTISEDKLQVLLKVLGSIPRKVIWKWETDDLAQKPSNVLIKKWLPQFDIMNHPNVKVYFGHGGLLGLSEGVHCGIPMVLMPLFGDQFQNSMAAKNRGVAVVLKYTELSEETLRHALDELFNNTMYRENAQKLSKAFRDRPASSLETAVWWTEYIARGNGLPYLRSHGSQMSWIERNLIDVTAFFFAIAAVVLYVVYQVAKYLFKYLSKRKKLVKSEKNGIASKKRD